MMRGRGKLFICLPWIYSHRYIVSFFLEKMALCPFLLSLVSLLFCSFFSETPVETAWKETFCEAQPKPLPPGNLKVWEALRGRFSLPGGEYHIQIRRQRIVGILAAGHPPKIATRYLYVTGRISDSLILKKKVIRDC